MKTINERDADMIESIEMWLHEIEPKWVEKELAWLEELRTRLAEEPVSDCHDLEEEVKRYYSENFSYITSDNPTLSILTNIARHFAEWGEKNAYKAIMKKADEVRDKRFDTDYEVKIEPAAGFDFGCVNVYREGKLVGQYVEPKEEKRPHEGVEEAAEKAYPSTTWKEGKVAEHITNLHCKKAFIAGYNLCKEQMMREAVKAKIYGYDDGSFELIASWLDMPNNSIYKDGDKVKIIIVKEEEQ